MGSVIWVRFELVQVKVVTLPCVSASAVMRPVLSNW
jgi:hypothetical protein